jgi:hypothetical protein
VRSKAIILAAALLLGGCALLRPLGGDEAGTDPRGRAMKQRGAAVVLALEHYRTANGRLPVHLFELVPKYIPQIPDGIFTDYQPDKNQFAFSYQAKPEDSTVTTCEIAIGHRVWNCYYKL